MQAEHPLNATAQTPEQHAVACWAALERHLQAEVPVYANCVRQWCGCFRDPMAGSVVIGKGCEVGEALAEEYEIASRRVREMQDAQFTLEPGDFEAVPS